MQFCKIAAVLDLTHPLLNTAQHVCSSMHGSDKKKGWQKQVQQDYDPGKVYLPDAAKLGLALLK